MADNNTYKVKQGDNLTSIATAHGLSLNELLTINPALDRNSVLKKDQEIEVPYIGFDYTVKRGDTLNRIAQTYGVAVPAIMAANPGMEENAIIRRGEKIRVPQEFYNYEVQRGDFLRKIADERAIGKVSLHTLMLANPQIDRNEVIHPGQEIRIPTGFYSHTVRAGEGLNKIATDYNLSLDDLRASNPRLRGGATIHPGDLIRIPSPSVQLAFAVAVKPPTAAAPTPAPPEKPDTPEESARAASRAENRRGAAHAFPTAYNIPAAATSSAWAAAARGITEPPVRTRTNSPLVVIDLGHGSRNSQGWFDPGNISRDKTLTEAEIVDAVGGSLVGQLAKAGYKVALTRDPGEVFLYSGRHQNMLERRAIHATNLEREIGAPYTVFVSLHVNSSAGNGGYGYEIRIPREREGENFHDHSERLGKHISREMGDRHQSVSRGVGEQSLAMFREFARQDGGKDAAVLVELDFLNNRAGQRRLETMHDKPFNIARGIFEGIESYIHQESPGYTPTAGRKTP